MVTTLEPAAGPPVNVAQAYSRINIETADQLSLITLLYDGLIRFLNQAKIKLENGESAHKDCSSARDIAHHLLHSTKDDGSEIAKNIRSLCFHMYREIIMADMERSAERIDNILPVAQNLRSGWAGLKKRETEKDANS
ncbi:MAG: flagellar export chaperone FliS [Candidatus Krumholzibacteriota bacterium]|nr:flagellar export chaperone FliS [Candidatus Krumholzibacteriota bacterium]